MGFSKRYHDDIREEMEWEVTQDYLLNHFAKNAATDIEWRKREDADETKRLETLSQLSIDLFKKSGKKRKKARYGYVAPHFDRLVKLKSF